MPCERQSDGTWDLAEAPPRRPLPSTNKPPVWALVVGVLVGAFIGLVIADHPFNFAVAFVTLVGALFGYIGGLALGYVCECVTYVEHLHDDEEQELLRWKRQHPAE